MNNEVINKINILLSHQKIDERAKPLIKLYFLGKLKSRDLALDNLEVQMDTLCSNISNVEFSSNSIVTAYSSKSNVLTINKQIFTKENFSKTILPVFMKFEEALNRTDRRPYANHIEDFIRAGRIAKATSIPISNELYKLYEMAEYSYGNIEHKADELEFDAQWKAPCFKYNDAINKMAITGDTTEISLLNGANLFHYEIFTPEAKENPDFEGPFKNEEYQKKAAKVLECIDYMNFTNNQNTIWEKEILIKNIKLFTGCTDQMIQEIKKDKYVGDERIVSAITSNDKGSSIELTEEFIVSRVQEMLSRKPDYDSRIKHLIVPFFIRSQKIYNWNIDEFQERLNEIDLKIDKIVFEDLDSITTLGDTAMDRIRLNSRVFFDKKRKTNLASRKNFFS